MPALVRVLPCALSLTLLVATLPGAAAAAECGGSVPCECGDTVVESTTLSGNIEGCSRTGLVVAAGVTLDCAGHGVIGRSSKDGIHIDEARDARVRNCRVEGFRTGIRVSGESGQLVSGNHLVGNRRGITIGDHAMDARLESNVVEGSREIGILLQGGTSHIQIVRNTVRDSRKENIRITASHWVVVDVNTLSGRPKVGLQVTHTHSGRFRGNEIQGSDVEVRGDSIANLFLDNDLLDGGFDVKSHDAGDVARAPIWNVFRGGSIPNARRCFRLAGASHNVIEDVSIGECLGRAVELKKSDGFLPVGNVIDLPTVEVGGKDEDGECGASKACACGDRVTSSVRLEEDLTGCGKTGLVVTAGVTLDCGGYGVYGKSSSDGIAVEGDEARVRNCRVQGFNSGVRLKNGNGHRLTDNVLGGNRRGIIVDGDVSDATLDKNLIEGSRDIGIEVRDGPTGIEITRNTILASNKQNIDVKLASGMVVENNVLGGKTKVGIRLTDTSGGRYRGNTIETEGVQVRGGSNANEFIDNDLEDLGFEFEGIEERSGPWRFPDGNLIRGGEVLSARRCFRFEGGVSNTVIEDVRVDECAGREVENKRVDGHVPTNNTVDVVVR